MKFRSLVLAALLALAGCAGTTSGPSDGRIAVVASFYPLQFVVERVGGDRVTVTTLTQPGVDPHDVELAPTQVAAVSRATLVVYQEGLQAAVDRVVATERPRQVLEATAVVPLRDLRSTQQSGGQTGPDAHAQQGADPHSWLDPTTMVAYGKAVAARLAELDPTHADEYAQRSDALAAELTQLDASFSRGLATCDRRTFVTAHAAFGYLAERYRLEQVSIAGLAPETEPSPARVAEVQRLARQTGVTTIFYETLTSPAVARSIAGDLGLRTDVLDPIEGLTGQSRGSDYIAVMTANLAALRTANGCR